MPQVRPGMPCRLPGRAGARRLPCSPVPAPLSLPGTRRLLSPWCPRPSASPARAAYFLLGAQEKSYFCLALPHGWWLMGLDLALVDDMDMCQYRSVPAGRVEYQHAGWVMGLDLALVDAMCQYRTVPAGRVGQGRMAPHQGRVGGMQSGGRTAGRATRSPAPPPRPPACPHPLPPDALAGTLPAWQRSAWPPETRRWSSCTALGVCTITTLLKCPRRAPWGGTLSLGHVVFARRGVRPYPGL